MYIHIHMNIYIYIYVRICICVYIYLYIHVYMCDRARGHVCCLCLSLPGAPYLTVSNPLTPYPATSLHLSRSVNLVALLLFHTCVLSPSCARTLFLVLSLAHFFLGALFQFLSFPLTHTLSLSLSLSPLSLFSLSFLSLLSLLFWSSFWRARSCEHLSIYIYAHSLIATHDSSAIHHILPNRITHQTPNNKYLHEKYKRWRWRTCLYINFCTYIYIHIYICISIFIYVYIYIYNIWIRICTLIYIYV